MPFATEHRLARNVDSSKLTALRQMLENDADGGQRFASSQFVDGVQSGVDEKGRLACACGT